MIYTYKYSAIQYNTHVKMVMMLTVCFKTDMNDGSNLNVKFERIVIVKVLRIKPECRGHTNGVVLYYLNERVEIKL